MDTMGKIWEAVKALTFGSDFDSESDIEMAKGEALQIAETRYLGLRALAAFITEGVKRFDALTVAGWSEAIENQVRHFDAVIMSSDVDIIGSIHAVTNHSGAATIVELYSGENNPPIAKYVYDSESDTFTQITILPEAEKETADALH